MSIREDIKAYIDGELSAARAEEVRQAIEADPDLMAEYTVMKEMTSSIAALVRQPQVKGAEKALDAARPKPRKRWIEALVVTGLFAIVGAITIPMFSRPPQAEMAKLNSPVPRDVAERAGGSDTGMELRESDADAEASYGESADLAPMLPPYSKEKANAGLSSLDMAPKDRKNEVQVPQESWEWENYARTSTLGIDVSNLRDAMDGTLEIAKSLDGSIVSTILTNSTDNQARLTIRVPSRNFSTAAAKLGSLGDVRSERKQDSDLTGQLKSTNDRLDLLKKEESNLVDAKAKGTREREDIDRKLEQVRIEIARQETAKKSLEAKAAFATITLTLTERPH